MLFRGLLLLVAILQYFELFFELLPFSHGSKCYFGLISFDVDSLRPHSLYFIFLELSVDGCSEWLEVILFAFRLHLS